MTSWINPFQKKREIMNHLKERGRGEQILPCPACGADVRRSELAAEMYVCPVCGYHHSLRAEYRIKTIADPGTFKELCRSLKGINPLSFPGYDRKLEETREKTGMSEAVICGTCRIDGIKTVICVMDGRFLMGSMGTAVGEKITRACEYATKKRLPLIIFSVSGGARMQEGILSLFQMAKTAAAVQRHSESGLLYLSVLTHPTTGGVTASFASLGDIILAEPQALIGFAGPRVIEQTIGQTLPQGFQRAEFQKEHGFVDAVTDRRQLRQQISLILQLHERRSGK
ncbi:MAG: acetyl-CoA carboxylase, carboxyltransferase subunit beta [Firmicutes bacterium]|nr:acetyl-CoA carboxylase, carboxyltransferase subunit beta [Bacillota bacterium]MDD7602837.1 acetyl-CoA carboxylase, carboxyltransferase subunit beta [Bacillota bacterium]MDY5855780.1 acetyl-CoA carboxylase, carboxyltransferase subunit beta [Anaerovoracaceae bacterium]